MSTYLGLHYHLVFSTKNRDPFINSSIRARLHEYLGGAVLGLDGEPHGIGGTADHVHLLVTLKSTHRLADFMRELKKGSTLWMQASGDSPKFGWQDGYCALTVSPSARPAVRKYIAGQEEHHRKKTFREELVELLRKAEVSYEEKFLD
jgi:putative transposase